MRSLLAVLCLCLFGDVVNGQEFLLFENQDQAVDSEYGWDLFNGFYNQPHASSIGDTSAVLTATPPGGFVSSTSNLYAFETVPTYTFTLSGLTNAQSQTSVLLQFATTEAITESQFDVIPDEFISLGSRSTLGFEGDSIPVNYYWAQWRGLVAEEDYSIVLTGAQMHVSFCGAKLAYANSDSLVNFTFGGEVLLGDVNCDGLVNLLDVQPFVELLSSGEFNEKADMNQDGSVNLLDISPFIDLLAG